jgi:Bacterial SH3 domain
LILGEKSATIFNWTSGAEMNRLSRRLVLPVVMTLSFVACQLDSRKQAVDHIVQFGLSSPFTIMNDGVGGTSYVAVADTALDDFNRIFDYLPHGNDVDSARYYYNRWINIILRDGTFSAVEATEYSLAADTLIASIAVRRPELSGFERTVVLRLAGLDSATLASRIERAKRELQVRDTLVLRVVAGPRIVSWSSAIRMRDSIPSREEDPVIVADLVESDREVSVPVAIAEEGENSLELTDPGDADLPLWVTTNANLRAGPGLNFDVVTTRPRGTELTADSLVDRWYHVRGVNGKVEGFISGSLVTVDSVLVSRPAEARKSGGTES